MKTDTFMWLCLVVICIFVQGFYAMLEMAIVSFNRLRLHYYCVKGIKRAIWLKKMLSKPTTLFGTTLLGVNIALQLGSECSRELYRSLNFNPDFAPITQIFIVLIFAELSPMLAARKYSESVVMLGMPIIYLSSIVMRPITFFIDSVGRSVNKILGGVGSEKEIKLGKDEVEKALEEMEANNTGSFYPINTLAKNIFDFRTKQAYDVLMPIGLMRMASSESTVAQLKLLFSNTDEMYLPIYHKNKNNVIGVIHARDLLQAQEHDFIVEYALSPWFVTGETYLFSLLEAFKTNRQPLAVVLNQEGAAQGIVTLDGLIDEIFGVSHPYQEKKSRKKQLSTQFIELSLPGNFPLQDFDRQYHTNLSRHQKDTLAELFYYHLGRYPEEKDSICIDNLEFTVQEKSLLSAKSIFIRSIIS